MNKKQKIVMYVGLFITVGVIGMAVYHYYPRIKEKLSKKAGK